jgi:hypothetical protein
MAYTKRSDAELLQAALFGYQHQHALLGERIAEITRELGSRAGHPEAASIDQPKGVRSAETRSRMAAAQRKRWAERKAITGTAANESGTKAQRKMSAAGRKRIAEATRRRWAAFRAAKAAAAK